MTTPAKRKAQSPLPKSPASTAPGPSSPGTKEKSPTPALASPTSKGKSPTPAPGPASPEAAPQDVLSGAHWLQQGLPERDADEDSTLGSDAESSTASLSSSILHYREINGRTYHSDSVTDGEYWGPNDARHLDALEIYTHGLHLVLGEKLYEAPLTDKIENAIDIGTGLGTWATDFGDEFPNCKVIGTDISPTQPTWCPPNVDFEINDATKDWVYKENFFDYIHIKFMNGAIEDWTELYKQAYKCCKPGGWIEHTDGSAIMECDDGTLVPGSALEQYGKVLAEAGRKINRTMTLAHDGTQEAGMKEAGFVNIHVKDFKVSFAAGHYSV